MIQIYKLSNEKFSKLLYKSSCKRKFANSFLRVISFLKENYQKVIVQWLLKHLSKHKLKVCSFVSEHLYISTYHVLQCVIMQWLNSKGEVISPKQ